MQAWLKKEADMNGTYSIEEINLIPTGVQGVAIVTGILVTSLVMIYPMWAVFSVVTGILLFANVCLRIWHIPLGLHCRSPRRNLDFGGLTSAQSLFTTFSA